MIDKMIVSDFLGCGGHSSGMPVKSYHSDQSFAVNPYRKQGGVMFPGLSFDEKAIPGLGTIAAGFVLDATGYRRVN